MKTIRRVSALLLCCSLLVLSPWKAIGQATLTTDLPDYPPGATAYIYGCGFQPFETVTMQVIHEDGSPPDTGDAHLPWNVSVDNSGCFVATWIVDEDAIGELLQANADGQSSSLHAEVQFTDAPPAGNLDQARNGDDDAPVTPIDWVNGNLGDQQSHYIEGHSVPYRLIMTNMPESTSVTVTLGYDIKHSDHHALDYLTHYDRMLPHTFIHGAIPEEIDPLLNTDLIPATSFTTFAFPAPSTAGSPVAGQPATSFNALPAGERVMTLYNGTLTGIAYVNPQGDLTAGQSETQIEITFDTPAFGPGDVHTMVLIWGGHIGSRADWGFVGADPRSAGGISGSPYHMRLIGWTLNNEGNQDRSLSAGAVAPPPDCGISGDTLICAGETTELCGLPGMASYLWSTGATTQCITIAAGSYTVTVTDANNASNTCTEAVTELPSPSCDISGDLDICDGQSTELDAGAGFDSYLWSTNETTQTITINAAGTYTVTVTNEDGCTSSCNATVIVNGLPTCSITGATAICSGGSAQWCATAGMASYLWSTTETTECITVSSAGTYTVTITDANGCSNSCNETLTVHDLPTCSITGTKEICSGNSTQWCATAGMASYLWSTGETTDCITVSSAGTYTVTITDASGCSSSCSETLIVNPLPVCDISGVKEVCDGDCVTWTASGGISFLWSTGATTASIDVCIAGTYTVTVTDVNGCSSTCSETLIVNPLPSCDISGVKEVCDGDCVTWTASGGISFLWSTGATTASIDVCIAGTYTVTVTDVNGCSSSCSETLIVNPLPSCDISGVKEVCDGDCVTWTASGGISFLWSTGATTASIDVCIAGTYTVTVTDVNGCSSSCSETLIVNPLPSCDISGVKEVCDGDCVTWTASGGISFLWSTGATTASIDVCIAGTYTVTVTDVNGCSNSCSETLIVNPLPSCDISGVKEVCDGDCVTWTASGGISFLWSTGATTASIDVCIAGTYTVTVTDVNGCSSTCSETLVVDPLPVCDISGGNEICNGQTTDFCATGGISFLWSNGATTTCITVSIAGTYTVTVTDVNGCSSTCSETLIVRPLPNCSISGPGGICVGTSTQFCTGGPAGTTFLWSTGETTACITVNTAGTYSVTKTNIYGCSRTCSKTLRIKPLPVCNINGKEKVCEGSCVTWTASGPLTYSFLWSTGATTKSISVCTAGTYTVTITRPNGCSSSCSKTLFVDPLPSCDISGNLVICNSGGSTEICASGGLTYLWNTGATTQCITVFTGETYVVTVTGANGCTSSCSADVIQAIPLDLKCDVNNNSGLVSVTVDGGTPPLSYLWSNGNTNASFIANAAGTYTVTVTDANGCSATCSATFDPCEGRTQTMGGWGAPPNGNNPAMYLQNNFAGAFTAPDYLTIGCTNKLRLTSSTAVMDFLPSGSTPSGLPAGTLINPGQSYSNVLAGQLVALTISLRMDAYDANFNPGPEYLGDYEIVSGTFAGWTVTQLWVEANNKIGGCASSYGYSAINDALNSINNNFDDGTQNDGFLFCPKDKPEPVRTAVAVNANSGSAEIIAKAYPNPFALSTTIEFKLTADKSETAVVEVYEMNGRKIATLMNETIQPNTKMNVVVDGSKWVKGVYIYRITCGDKISVGKLFLMD